MSCWELFSYAFLRIINFITYIFHTISLFSVTFNEFNTIIFYIKFNTLNSPKGNNKKEPPYDDSKFLFLLQYRISFKDMVQFLIIDSP